MCSVLKAYFIIDFCQVYNYFSGSQMKDIGLISDESIKILQQLLPLLVQLDLVNAFVFVSM